MSNFQCFTDQNCRRGLLYMHYMQILRIPPGFYSERNFATKVYRPYTGSSSDRITMSLLCLLPVLMLYSTVNWISEKKLFKGIKNTTHFVYIVGMNCNNLKHATPHMNGIEWPSNRLILIRSLSSSLCVSQFSFL